MVLKGRWSSDLPKYYLSNLPPTFSPFLPVILVSVSSQSQLLVTTWTTSPPVFPHWHSVPATDPCHYSSNIPILFLPLLFPLFRRFSLPDFHMTLSLISFRFLLKLHPRREAWPTNVNQHSSTLYISLFCFTAVRTTLLYITR